MPKDSETVVTVVTQAMRDEALQSQGTPCLVVFYGKNLGKRHFLDKPELILGRSDSTNIQIDQESASRQHAKVLTDNGRAKLYDLGSTNGTFVNDQRIENVELRDGDLVRIGQTIFKYLSGSNIETKYHEEIYRLTTIDGLTQAYNKRYFLETLARELNRAMRYDRALALAMFDIDHFKKINDTYGHLAGDHVLRELATLVTQAIRRDDVFSRYGGEEFSLIYPEVDLKGAALACEKVRSRVETHQFTFNNQNIPVTISMGVRALVHGENVDATHFIADADAKLYQAKQSGRNRVCS